MKEEKGKILKLKGNTNYAYILAGGTVLVLLCVIILLNINKVEKQYIIQNEDIENTEIATAYVIKDEVVVEKDTNKVLLPVAGESERVAKHSIIATYKGTDYDAYQKTLEDLDKQIHEHMKDLPVVYSSEIENIENQIYLKIKEANNENSYIKMQEYKTEINSLINKRAELIGSLSPDGASIKELISERNEYVKNAKKSTDNILSPKAGIVSYETDGLEDILKYKDIDNITINSAVEACKNIVTSNNKIKVVDNYKAYLITKVSSINYEYMKLNKEYTIRSIGDNSATLKGELTRINQVEDGYEIVFKISNGIEHLISAREMEIEIVWWNTTGLFVLRDAVYEENGISYVKVIKYGKYSEIPIKVLKHNENYCIIDNYSNSEIKEKGLKREYSIKVYDRLVVTSSESEEEIK